MTAQRHTSHSVIKPRSKKVLPMDVVILEYEDRYLRRKVLTCVHGDEILVDLPKATVLEHGDQLVLETGHVVEVIAGEEDLIEIRGDEENELTKLAYHLGNRHLPVQIEPDRLLIKYDHVIEDMLRKLEATMRRVSEPFQPEGGAYGHGRTHGHDHGHNHEH